MKNLIVSSWFLVIFLFLVNISWAGEEPDVESLRQEIQVLREEVKTLREELKAVKKETPKAVVQKEIVSQEDLQGVRTEVETLREQWKRALERKTAQTTRALTFGGTVQTRYTHTEDETTYRGFSISSLILSFKGNLRKDYELGRNLDYAFSLSSDTTDSYRVKPLDAYLSYSILPSLDKGKPRLSLSLGQQKKPFGLDPQATEEYKPTIKSAQFDSKLGLGTRDIGIVAKGDLFPYLDYGFDYRVPLIEYSLAVFNGAGPNKSDDNNKKDLAARIILKVPSDYNSIWRGFSLGGSYYNGQKKRTLTSGTTTITCGEGDIHRVGADLAYVRTPIGVSAEYAKGEDESLSGTLANNRHSTIKSDGYAFSLFYNFGQQFVKGFKSQERYDDWYPLTYQPFVRFDRWDANKHLAGDRTDIITLGFNWFFAETTKLQLNYNIKKEETSQIDNNEFLVQFQYGF
jgi:hypothetical protein